MSLHGAYPADDQDEDYPRSKHGHPKDRRYDLKQIQTGLAVTGDGGIPLLSRVIDGEAAEISQITGTMNALRTMAGPKEFLLIADSKLVSYRNITTLIKAGCDFIALAPAATVDDAVYARPHGRILQPSNNYTSPVARAASLIRQLSYPRSPSTIVSTRPASSSRLATASTTPLDNEVSRTRPNTVTYGVDDVPGDLSIPTFVVLAAITPNRYSGCSGAGAGSWC